MSSIFITQIRFLIALALVTALPCFSIKAEESTVRGGSLLANTAGWQLSFDPDSSKLDCRHPALGVQVTGRLSFFVVENGKRIQWSIQKARDFATQRLV